MIVLVIIDLVLWPKLLCQQQGQGGSIPKVLGSFINTKIDPSHVTSHLGHATLSLLLQCLPLCCCGVHVCSDHRINMMNVCYLPLKTEGKKKEETKLVLIKIYSEVAY